MEAAGEGTAIGFVTLHSRHLDLDSEVSVTPLGVVSSEKVTSRTIPSSRGRIALSIKPRVGSRVAVRSRLGSGMPDGIKLRAISPITNFTDRSEVPTVGAGSSICDSRTALRLPVRCLVATSSVGVTDSSIISSRMGLPEPAQRYPRTKRVVTDCTIAIPAEAISRANGNVTDSVLAFSVTTISSGTIPPGVRAVEEDVSATTGIVDRG